MQIRRELVHPCSWNWTASSSRRNRIRKSWNVTEEQRHHSRSHTSGLRTEDTIERGNDCAVVTGIWHSDRSQLRMGRNSLSQGDWKVMRESGTLKSPNGLQQEQRSRVKIWLDRWKCKGSVSSHQGSHLRLTVTQQEKSWVENGRKNIFESPILIFKKS